MPAFYKHGFVLGSTTAAAMPSVPFTFKAVLRAKLGNGGNVLIGGSGLTVVGSTATDATSGYQLDAGDTLTLMGPGNLSNLYIINDSTNADGLLYFVEG